MILEEGLDVALLRRILRSLRLESEGAGVTIRCGDTKVVDRGKADGIFIATSGIGIVPPGRNLSVARAMPGDAVLLSGPIGQHGIAVLAAREGSISPRLRSRIAPASTGLRLRSSKRARKHAPCGTQRAAGAPRFSMR